MRFSHVVLALAIATIASGRSVERAIAQDALSPQRSETGPGQQGREAAQAAEVLYRSLEDASGLADARTQS